MSLYITKQYADMLTKEDVLQLFDQLQRKFGSRNKASKICGFTNKTTYEWEKVKYVKSTTKEKLLKASLQHNFLYTLEYLFNRSNRRNVNILSTFLSTLYSFLLESESKNNFEKNYLTFFNFKTKNRGLIRDQIEDELSDMYFYLIPKANELKAQLPPIPTNDISSKELLDAIPLLCDMYLMNPSNQPKTIAHTINFPPDSVIKLWSIFEKIHFSSKEQPSETSLPSEEEIDKTTALEGLKTDFIKQYNNGLSSESSSEYPNLQNVIAM